MSIATTMEVDPDRIITDQLREQHDTARELLENSAIVLAPCSNESLVNSVQEQLDKEGISRAIAFSAIWSLTDSGDAFHDEKLQLQLGPRLQTISDTLRTHDNLI